MSWTNYQPTTGQWQGQQGTEELEQQQQWMQQQQQVNWMPPAWANVGVNPQTQWPAEDFFPRFTPYVAEVAPLTPYVLTPLGSRAAAPGIDNQTRAPLQPVPSPVPEVPPLPGQVPEGFCLGPVSYAQGEEGCCDDHDDHEQEEEGEEGQAWGDEEENYVMAVYCKECETWLNSQQQWGDHEIGKRHVKNVRKARRGNATGSSEAAQSKVAKTVEDEGPEKKTEAWLWLESGKDEKHAKREAEAAEKKLDGDGDGEQDGQGDAEAGEQKKISRSARRRRYKKEKEAREAAEAGQVNPEASSDSTILIASDDRC